MTFGAQTLIFVTVTDGPPDRNGEPTRIESEETVTGCRFRPLKTDEKVAAGIADITTEVWQATCPPVQAAIEATSTGAVKYLGETFQVEGQAQPFTDFSNHVFKVTVLCKRQE